jgi:hypothetical protein
MKSNADIVADFPFDRHPALLTTGTIATMAITRQS